MSPLSLQTSRGDNVSRGARNNVSEENWATPPQKKQKISHQASSQASRSATDEVLDQQSPEKVIFVSMPSQATSSQSFNSQGSDLLSNKHGSLSGFHGHRNVERMMDSNEPSKRRKRRAAKRTQQNGTGRLSSPDLATQTISLSGSDERERALSKHDDMSRTPWHDMAQQKASADDEMDRKYLISKQDSATSNTSPYFAPSDALSKQWRSTVNQKDKQKSLDELFISTNGTRRSSDMNMSSDIDELQLGTTVGSHQNTNVLSSIGVSHTHSPSKDSSSTLKVMPPGDNSANLDPSNIRGSTFTSSKPKLESSLQLSGPPVRERKAPWAANIVAVRVEDRFEAQDDMGLVHKESKNAYVLMSNGESTHIKIIPQKLQRVYMEKSGCKARFMLSKSGTEDNLVDLEFCNEKSMVDVVNRLQNETTFKISLCARYVSYSIRRGYVSDLMVSVII